VERTISSERVAATMTNAATFRSGKGHRYENFPVASYLIRPRYREIILGFYEFVRIADDIADHPSLTGPKKLDLLNQLESDLTGISNENAEAVILRSELAKRGISNRHALDVLTAFKLDVTKQRYRDWEDLIEYCSYSAMPVGRFVLDVHGESSTTWPASDALCAALQIINHLQDCSADYRNLDRVYIPLDFIAASGADIESLGHREASPALRRCLREIALRSAVLLRESETLSMLVRDQRLGLEISVIQELARKLVNMLARRDPLSQRVHLTAAGAAGLSLIALAKGFFRRLGRHFAISLRKPRDA
jgi:squalene synthase HpnC